MVSSSVSKLEKLKETGSRGEAWEKSAREGYGVASSAEAGGILETDKVVGIGGVVGIGEVVGIGGVIGRDGVVWIGGVVGTVGVVGTGGITGGVVGRGGVVAAEGAGWVGAAAETPDEEASERFWTLAFLACWR